MIGGIRENINGDSPIETPPSSQVHTHSPLENQVTKLVSQNFADRPATANLTHSFTAKFIHDSPLIPTHIRPTAPGTVPLFGAQEEGSEAISAPITLLRPDGEENAPVVEFSQSGGASWLELARDDVYEEYDPDSSNSQTYSLEEQQKAQASTPEPEGMTELQSKQVRDRLTSSPLSLAGGGVFNPETGEIEQEKIPPQGKSQVHPQPEDFF